MNDDHGTANTGTGDAKLRDAAVCAIHVIHPPDIPVPPAPVAVVIAARNEADRVGATVRAARALPGVDLVVVVDDGSTDATATAATRAGARVLRHPHRRGKGAAMMTGAEAVRRVEAHAGSVAENRATPPTPPRHLLFLDADLAASARHAAPLVDAVCDGSADMTIGLIPPIRPRLGGHGIVVSLARTGILRATGWEAEQPLSGQRCLTRTAFDAALPLAHGFGAEVGLTIDLLHKGFRTTEVEVPLSHRPTGPGPRGQAHRVRQLTEVGRALITRATARSAISTQSRITPVTLAMCSRQY